ncbi:hypothetical protein AVEN_11535-1 [Araneus ventricosus]|uniref:Uncharacterized protein n=1 Tax=Araneus ventricosus TaxID=182803 RepID=A0A4Y2LRI4_ARAVE|nr:hypothetical protein AVEN_11535-1 [Araneus ventricosus]
MQTTSRSRGDLGSTSCLRLNVLRWVLADRGALQVRRCLGRGGPAVPLIGRGRMLQDARWLPPSGRAPWKRDQTARGGHFPYVDPTCTARSLGDRKRFARHGARA